MGDSDCVPCYETVDVHHRPQTTTTTATTVPSSVSIRSQRRHEHHDRLNVDPTGLHGAGAPNGGVVVVSSNGHNHRKFSVAGNESVVGLSNKKSGEGDLQQQHHLLRKKPLTPAASEDHHDSDYDEISIHPLSNQVRNGCDCGDGKVWIAVEDLLFWRDSQEKSSQFF